MIKERVYIINECPCACVYERKCTHVRIVQGVANYICMSLVWYGGGVVPGSRMDVGVVWLE